MNDIYVRIEPPEEIKIKVQTDERKTQTKQVTPKEEGFSVTPDAGFLLERVDVGAVPWVRPQGTLPITKNGPVNVEQYAEADVQIPPPVLQQRTATPTEQQQTIEPQEGFDALSAVTVKAIPTQYIVPTGTKRISADGTYDVTAFAAAQVNTAPEKGFIFGGWDANGYPTTFKTVGLTRIENYAMENWGSNTVSTNQFFSRLSRYEFNEGLTYIGNNCLRNNKLIEELIIPSTCPMVSNGFGGCTNLKRVVVKSYVQTFPQGMCGDNSNLEEFICESDFGEFVWPRFPNTMKLYDLSRVTHVPRVYLGSAEKDLGGAEGCIVKVPMALLEAFQTAAVWKDTTWLTFIGV